MKQTGIQRAESHTVIKVRIWISHLACLGVFFVPLTTELLVACIAGYIWRVLAMELAAHRYFSHRAFRTSRPVQCVLGLMVAASGHRGPIWWAMHHRQHHRHSDGPLDVHSPVTHSFWHAHMGWLTLAETADTDLDAVKDLSRVPELVWINRWHMLFPLAVLVITVLLGAYTPLFGSTGMGWAAAIWAFFVPTVLGLHAAFAVNTLVHGRRVGFFNRRPFDTGDTTTNSWLLAIPTLGASWHNNHHRVMNAARAGFYWWQLDLTYLTLRALQAMRLVWGLQVVPAAVLAEGREGRQRQQQRGTAPTVGVATAVAAATPGRAPSAVVQMQQPPTPDQRRDLAA
ncbi:MAG: fatty acid desaturase [Rubrivivax sp.]|nr:fatty acid desaturase [Rubrivivax sp.]